MNKPPRTYHRLLCWIFGHKLNVLLKITPITTGLVCAVECLRCERHYIFSEEHKVFLRYDDDPCFQRDIREMYQLEALP